jgi:hypothetical protein
MVTLPEIEPILREFVGKRPALKATTRLQQDLHLAGDDVGDLLEKIAATYRTDFSALDFAAFFPDESEALSYYWTSLIGWKSDKREFTLGHLLDVINKGQWFEPAASGD